MSWWASGATVDELNTLSGGVDGGGEMPPIRGVNPELNGAPLVASVNGTCPTGYGTIYKYDGTTECVDPRTPDIANVIAAETQGGPMDRLTIGVADTLKTGVDAVQGAARDLAAAANPLGSWGAALLWVGVVGFGVYAVARLIGR